MTTTRPEDPKNGAARSDETRAPVASLHHVTAIASDAQANHDFYTAVLGLRLVKKTVNFDDPGSYHLYYGDAVGAPGTALTFFPWRDLPRGRPGLGQTVLTQFSAPPGSLDFWVERLRAHGAPVHARETLFGEERIISEDPDGMGFTITEVAKDARADGGALWTTPEIGADVALRGFHGVTLALAEASPTARVLTEGFDYRREAEEPGFVGDKPARLIRYRGEGPGAVVDIHEAPGLARGRDGAGVVHHIAFSVKDRAAQAEVSRRLAALGHPTTPQIDRDYFWAIYFRTPGGVLFEVATDEPGFERDEPRESLGAALKLPSRYETMRARIEQALPPLETGA
ncbi:MAG: ring-cleaving dioxygenase [Pseudomonadota bacterium]